ncbi:uncharacterized protein LOC122720973 [Apis laboriosa]|uniref:uncharacterized protein LOC122720973 n=1 Tax=Apis laboriosa TaxID=183418 RepID=UPI001CC70C56|nr:uncharacterized protein LOC122720973 [Apis laboriosa]
MMQASQNFDKTVDRLLPPKPHRNQRLYRPEDAKTLGLRVPDSESFSAKSNSSSSKSSAHLSNTKYVGKRSNDDTRSKKDVKRHRNVDVNVKATKKQPDLKQERKAQRTPTLERLSNLHAKLERGLKNISNRTKTRSKVGPESAKESSNLNSTTIRGYGRSSGRSLKKNSTSQEDKLRKESSSKCTKQLFSMADSWSSDSIVSHSDNCACCHSREPCPFHGSENFFQEK